MRVPRRVVWSEGMLISPHHLQQQDRFHEELLGERLDALEPLSWGVAQLQVDTQELAKGRFRLQSFRGITPDGSALVLEGQDVPNPQAFAEHWAQPGTNLSVHLILPRERAGADNYADSPSTPARFSRRSQRVSDQASSSGEMLDISFGAPQPRFAFGPVPPPECESLKIAEIQQGSGGGYVLSSEYVPPCMRVAASPFLIDGVRNLQQQLLGRRRALAETRREVGGGIALSAADMTPFLMLHTIHGALPFVQHLCNDGAMHPRLAYLELASLAGQLTTFSAVHGPQHVPAFIYTDLQATFGPLFALLTELLEASFEPLHVSVVLEAGRDGVFSATLEQPKWPSCAYFLLAVESNLAAAQVGAELPALAKVASWADIPAVLRGNVRGVSLSIDHKPPPEIPVKSRHVYFDLETKSGFFKAIIADRNIAVHLPPEFDPRTTKVMLYGVPARG